MNNDGHGPHAFGSASTDGLACEQFEPDPHSRFCNKCGYEQGAHRRARTVLASDCRCDNDMQERNPNCAIHGSQVSASTHE